ncbi:hypothetical protein [Streptomyces sp. NBC_01283]
MPSNLPSELPSGLDSLVPSRADAAGNEAPYYFLRADVINPES